MFWSEIGSGFGKRGSTSLPRILSNTPHSPGPGNMASLRWTNGSEIRRRDRKSNFGRTHHDLDRVKFVPQQSDLIFIFAFYVTSSNVLNFLVTLNNLKKCYICPNEKNYWKMLFCRQRGGRNFSIITSTSARIWSRGSLHATQHTRCRFVPQYRSLIALTLSCARFFRQLS